MSGPYAIGSDKWPGLAKLAEECGEVVQVIGKIIAIDGEAEHWDGTNLVERLSEELADVHAALSFVIRYCKLDRAAIELRAQQKRDTFVMWHHDQGGWEDPTHGLIDRDIQDYVETLKPTSVGQRVALQNTMQEARRKGRPLAALNVPERHDHDARCCRTHKTHSNPHVGCILR